MITNEKQNKTNEEEMEVIEVTKLGANPFAKCGKLARSPVKVNGSAQRSPLMAGITTTATNVALPKMTENQPNAQEGTPVALPTTVAVTESSPRQKFIIKMRKEEECALQAVRKVLRTMKNAIKVQKNIKKDVQQGVVEIEEILDQVEMYRRNWLNAEEAKRQNEAEEQRICRVRDPVDTPEIQSKLRKKRLLPSPLENDTPNEKKLCGEETGTWQTVKPKRRRTRNRTNSSGQPQKAISKDAAATKPQPKPEKAKSRNKDRSPKGEAVLIKPSGEHMYAKILKNLRINVKPDDSNVKIRTVRKTMTGALLLELDRGTKISTDFCKKITATLEHTATVIGLRPTATVEIQDLDALTTAAEIEHAIKQILKNDTEDMRVSVTKPNNREMVRAYVTLEKDAAHQLNEIGRITVGWIRAKMRIRSSPKRCFRCLGSGHIAANCKGPNRGNLCIRCGEPGHKMRECSKPPKCCVCVAAGLHQVDHIPASGKCASYKARA